MPSYEVSETAFFTSYNPESLPYAQRIEAAVAQIARRYDIRNKSILSLGGGTGLEEYFFWHHGNHLTIVDIDENGVVEPLLKTAPSGNLRYIIEDAHSVQLSEQYDVLFMSSFTPDELRRDGILRNREDGDLERMVQMNNDIWEWPWWREPFHPLLMRFAGNLRDGGTMLVQSYCGSLDVTEHRYYLWTCDRQLAAHGLFLRELYRFSATRGTMLYVISKGTPRWPLFPPLTLLHGRAEPEPVQCLRIAGPPSEHASLWEGKQAEAAATEQTVAAETVPLAPQHARAFSRLKRLSHLFRS